MYYYTSIYSETETILWGGPGLGGAPSPALFGAASLLCGARMKTMEIRDTKDG